MPDPLRYILIGTGGYGAVWCRSVLPHLMTANLAIPVAAVDTNREALKFAPREYLRLPPEHCFTSLIEAAETRQADFAVLVTPPHTHEAIIDIAMTFDLDVLVERPLADTLAGCCRIKHKVNEAGRKLAVAVSHRYDQDKQSLRHL